MNRKLYARGMIGQYWYNFTELLAYALTFKPVPNELIYTKKLYYGQDKMQYINTCERKDVTDEKKPLLIYIHGGGWISGITEMRNTYLFEWAKKGFFVASVSYTYAPQKVYPYQLKEVFSAIDFILDNAEIYNIDTENIVLAGESAGGYFVTYAASCATDNSVLDKLNIEFRHRDSFKVNAIVSHCGCYSIDRLTDISKKQSKFPDIKMMVSTFMGMNIADVRKQIEADSYNLISPVVTEYFPPIFVTWGDKDLLRYEAFDFADELKKNNVPYVLYKSDGVIGLHAWSIVTLFKKSRICLDEAFKFVSQYISYETILKN
ncbi:MAG: alpha/beta hydrolase [Clostridia bacterium]|nr:alpha/beta hydrolase [Clostridia bacterium]